MENGAHNLIFDQKISLNSQASRQGLSEVRADKHVRMLRNGYRWLLNNARRLFAAFNQSTSFGARAHHAERKTHRRGPYKEKNFN